MGLVDEAFETRQVFHDQTIRSPPSRAVQIDDAAQERDDLEEQPEAAVLLLDAGLHVPAEVPLVHHDGPPVEGGVELVGGPDAAEQAGEVGRVLAPRRRVHEVQPDGLGVAHGLRGQLRREVAVLGEVGVQGQDGEQGRRVDPVLHEAQAEGLADGGRQALGEFRVGQDGRGVLSEGQEGVRAGVRARG